MKAENTDSVSQLRELIRKNDKFIYQFLFLMLGGSNQASQLVIRVFREFGQRYKKISETPFLESDIRRALFQMAWRKIRESEDPTLSQWTVGGRDLRSAKDMEADLLETSPSRAAPVAVTPEFLRRLSRVDLEFRAPLVLKDVLGLEDEEVMQILQLRWGVYRHRLNRGRLDFCEVLRGRPYLSTTSLVEVQR